MFSPRALFASFVILSMLSTLAACGNRKPLKDVKKESAEQAAAGINGTYRTEAQIQGDSENYVTAKFGMLEIKDNQLTSKALNPDTLALQSDVIGTLRPAGGLTFEIDAVSNLEQLIQNRQDLVSFARMFDSGARVRLLLKGDQLSLVSIRGNDQGTPAIYRKIEPKDAEEQLTKVTDSARKLRDFRVNLLKDWGAKKLYIHKRESVSKAGGEERREVVEGGKIPAETGPNEGGKKTLQFKIIELLSATEGRTNETHKAEVQLLMLRKDSTLWINYVSAADPATYVAASMLVKITKTDGGELVLEENLKDRRVIRTYRAEPAPAVTAEQAPAAETPPVVKPGEEPPKEEPPQKEPPKEDSPIVPVVGPQ